MAQKVRADRRGLRPRRSGVTSLNPAVWRYGLAGNREDW
jgi:hypothetical protein